MKEWESQNLISLLRLKLRVQAIKELISVWCVQGPGNTHPRFLPWAESREVKSSAQQAGVGHTACPATEDGAGHSVSPPRRMGLAVCAPAEDGARHSVSAPRNGAHCMPPRWVWGSRRVPPRRMGLAPDGHRERELWASATAADRVALEGSLSAASFTLGRSSGSDPEGVHDLHRASALQRVEAPSATFSSGLPGPSRCYRTTAFISHASKVMLKILQARL